MPKKKDEQNKRRRRGGGGEEERKMMVSVCFSLNLCSFWELSRTFFLPTLSICHVIFSRELVVYDTIIFF